MTAVPPMERVKAGVGRSFHIPQPFTHLSVYENLLVAARFGAGLGQADAVTLCLSILNQAGPAGVAKQPGVGLTMLQPKRLELARAMATKPRLEATVFLLTSFGTGLCGALIFMQITPVTPDAAFSVADWTAFQIFTTVIGGISTLPGPIVGVLIFHVLQSSLPEYGTVYLIILGLIGIAIMLFARRGLWVCFSTGPAPN